MFPFATEAASRRPLSNASILPLLPLVRPSPPPPGAESSPLLGAACGAGACCRRSGNVRQAASSATPSKLKSTTIPSRSSSHDILPSSPSPPLPSSPPISPIPPPAPRPAPPAPPAPALLPAALVVRPPDRPAAEAGCSLSRRDRRTLTEARRAGAIGDGRRGARPRRVELPAAACCLDDEPLPLCSSLMSCSTSRFLLPPPALFE